MQECRTHQTGRRGQRARLQTDVACLDKESCVLSLFVPSSLLFSRGLFVSSLSTKLLLIDVHDDLNAEHEYVSNCCKNVRILSYKNSPIHLVFLPVLLKLLRLVSLGHTLGTANCVWREVGKSLEYITPKLCPREF